MRPQRSRLGDKCLITLMTSHNQDLDLKNEEEEREQ